MTRFTFPRPRSLSPGPHGRRRRLWPAAAVVTAAALATMAAGASAAGAGQAGFRQVNLVSDIPGVAPLTDPDLLNAWGLAATPGTDQAPGSPLWVSDNGSGKTTLFAGATADSVAQVLVVNITAGAPTGQVFNPDRAGFFVHDAVGHAGPALFIFASENGAIDAWNPGRRRHRDRAVNGDRNAHQQRRQRRLQGPGHRPGIRWPHLPLRHQLPVRASRGL